MIYGYQKVIVLATAFALLALGCGKHGQVSNGGVSLAAATGGQVGALSSDKKAQTGSITQMSIPMAYGHPNMVPRVSTVPKPHYAAGAKPNPVSAAMYQQFQRNPKAALEFIAKSKQSN